MASTVCYPCWVHWCRDTSAGLSMSPPTLACHHRLISSENCLIPFPFTPSLKPSQSALLTQQTQRCRRVLQHWSYSVLCSHEIFILWGLLLNPPSHFSCFFPGFYFKWFICKLVIFAVDIFTVKQACSDRKNSVALLGVCQRVTAESQCVLCSSDSLS